LYQIAYVYIRNYTEGATWLNNVVVLKYFTLKTADNKTAD